jgi:hypothetical protein
MADALSCSSYTALHLLGHTSLQVHAPPPCSTGRKKRVIQTFFLPSVESGAAEDSITSRGVAVAADRCVAVAEARSVGDLGEKEKRREKKREPRGREAGAGAARIEMEKYFGLDQSFYIPKNIVVQLKLWF